MKGRSQEPVSLRQAWGAATDPSVDLAGINPERSFNRIRVLAGGLGLALPILLVVGDAAFLPAEWSLRGSLSAYYHSGMRDVFVGVLVGTGIALIAYRIANQGDLRNLVSTVAGVLVIAVALLPTGRPEELDVAQTPLQRAVGEDRISFVHAVCAFLFIGLLCVMSRIFWMRERRRKQGANPLVHSLGAKTHAICLTVMLVSCAYIGINLALEKLFHLRPLQEEFIFFGEWGAIWGFAVSWLAQGAIHATTKLGSLPPSLTAQVDSAGTYRAVLEPDDAPEPD